jgi:broad specificity phosphatase PhoE
VALIWWARHGENVANLTGTFSHRIFDGDLTGTGRRQAEALAGYLATVSGARVGALVCSPLRRARQTAQIIGSRLGLPVACELDDLRELDVGALDGRSDPAAWDIYAAVLAAWRQGDTQARFPGGENCDELCARLRRALVTAARTSPAAATLIVAHGASLRAALPGLTGRPDPGTDMPTATVACLHVGTRGSAPAIGLLSWPQEPA